MQATSPCPSSRASPRPSPPPSTPCRAGDDDAAQKNRPLVEDIRLLGRILGDVIREQEGHDAFELIERVRQLSVAYRLKQRRQRRPRARPPAEEPVGRPDGQRDPRLQLLLAPGQHRRRPPPRAPPRASTSAQGHLQEGSLAHGLRAPARRRHAAPTRSPRRWQQAYICAGADRPPDRGAAQEHPRRRARHRRAGGRARRAWPPTRERADNEALLRARVTQLWQTRMLRTAKLTVADEIENALSATTTRTFLRQIPRLYARASSARCPATRCAPFLRMGHWIGGDRDGNPNVSAAHAAAWRWRARPRWRCATT